MREAIRIGIIRGIIIGSYAVLGYLIAREIMRGSL
jgi:hypothetical protein